MRYKVTHTTTYNYSQPVQVCHNRVILSPRGDSRVNVRSHRMNIRPVPDVNNRRTDYFGNTVYAFSIEQSHKQLSVTATSRVDIQPFNLPDAQTTAAWEAVRDGIQNRTDPDWLKNCLYGFDSPRVTRSGEFQLFAEQSFLPGRPVLEAALELTRAIFESFDYDSKATTVTTKTEDSFRLKKGVCQDFAHIEIACLRSLGLPARYVSGYLRTVPPPGKPRLVGADQSHAWLSIYCGAEVGWVDVDPTNNCICSTDHVPVAYGRDYGDVTPMKGVFLGGGKHTLNVSVDVLPIAGANPSSAPP